MPVELFGVNKSEAQHVNGTPISVPNSINSEILSEKAQEIISQRPGVLLRLGNLFLLAALVIIIVSCWLIRYPDMVRANGRLTSINAPKPVITVTSGKLVELFVDENEMVRRGDILGYIESTGNHKNVLNLSVDIDSIEHALRSDQPELIRRFDPDKYMELGELQPSYQTFSHAYYSFSNYLIGGFYLKKRAILLKDMKNLERLRANLILQRDLQQQDLAVNRKTFEANQSLNASKVISDFDFRAEQSKLLGKELTLPQINSSIISNENQQNEKAKEILELENAIEQQKSIFLQAFYTFKSQLEEWRKKYLLIAPINGKVTFETFVQKNQQLQANQMIFFINPENSRYFAEVVIPQSNFGKVSEGQQVHLKLSSYPFQEFGFIHGKIKFISRIPSEGGYLAKVEFPDGLRTSNKKYIQYREGLVADAEIITNDLRLLERFYYGIKKQLQY